MRGQACVGVKSEKKMKGFVQKIKGHQMKTWSLLKDTVVGHTEEFDHYTLDSLSYTDTEQ